MRWMGVMGMVFLLACKSGQQSAVSPLEGTDGGPPDTGGQLSNPHDGGPAGAGGSSGVPDGGVAFVRPPAWPPPRPGYANPVPAENQHAGDPRWHSGFSNPWAQQIEAYADRVSAGAGDTVRLMVRSDSADHSASWTLYRLGWYGGAGARALLSGTTAVNTQAPCANDRTTGLVRCSWTPTFAVTIPADAVSGLFLVRIVRDDNIGVLIPLVVKDDRLADLFFQASVTTAQAYNDWGGESLYSDSDDGIAGGFAVQVSFDRPYASGGGSGQMLRYEALMARWLERYGYDVSYTTNLDVAREGVSALLRRGAFLSVGHDEYWPGEERTAVQAARDNGVPLFFFGGNEAYWKVRLSAPGADGNARVITCYKKHPENDPLAGTPDRTGRYRDPPIDMPEEALSGAMYESWLLFGQPWTVINAAHPVYAGTGVHEGDTIPQLVGYEYNRAFDYDTPAPATALSHSPLVDAEGKPGYAESMIYTAPSGAQVFTASSIYWAKGLDGPLRDARVERMTANLLQLGLRLPVPDALKTITAPAPTPPDAAWATDVTTLATGMPGPAGVAQLPDGSFVIADARAHRIWRADSTGHVTAFAGDGNPDGNPRYDNVPALQARFFQPTAVLTDAAGNVYVSDTYNCAIRKIGTDAYRTVTTIAGALFQCGYKDGIGGVSRLSDPMGLAWQDATHIVIADMSNHAIRVLDLATNTASTLAITHGGDDQDGPASSATFYYPTAVAVGGDGRVYFVASSTGKLKVIGTDAAHTVTTLVSGGLGFADGPGTTARMQPQGGLLWNGGTLIVSDSANQRLRLVTPGTTAATTRVQTWAGSGQMGTSDGTARLSSFEVPLGLIKAVNGVVYVADGGGGSLRAVRP